MENYSSNNLYEWNSTIEDDSEGSSLLETGDYNAVISWIERSRYNGGKKLPPCYMAKITLRVATPDGPYEIDARLYLHKRMEWKLSEFFRAVGRKRHGERLEMSWDGLIGLPVRVRIVKKEFTGDDGEKKLYNEVTKFYDYDPANFPSDPAWLQEAMKAEEEPLDEVF